MGSTRKAQVCGVMASARACTSPKGITLKPGVNGPKPSRYCASVEKLTWVIVRPWKLLAQTMISALPSGMPLILYPHLRAAVHGQRHVIPGQLVKFFVKKRELVIAKSPRGQSHLVRLLDHRLQNLG